MKIAFDTYGMNTTKIEDCFFYFSTTMDGSRKLWDLDSRSLDNNFTERYSYDELKTIKVFALRDVEKGYGLIRYKTVNGFLKAVNKQLNK